MAFVVLARARAAMRVDSTRAFHASTGAKTAPAAAPAASAWPAQPLHYARAIVRGIAPNFAADALRSHSAAAIDGARAQAQHDAYVAALKQLVPSVVSLPAETSCADSVFVEDTAIVVGGVALVTRPGAPSRRKEVAGVRDALKEMGLTVVEAAAPATIDGGDVLFTGREFFVGVSRRTNRQGVEALARTFPGYKVTAVPLASLLPSRPAGVKAAAAAAAPGGAPALHLKSFLSLVGPDAVAVADSPFGRAVAFHMQDRSTVPRAIRASGQALTFVLVPDAPAANAVYANGKLLVRAESEYPASYAALGEYAAEAGVELVGVDASELAKADGALTCCSILMH